MNNIKGPLPFTRENTDNVFVKRIKTQTRRIEGLSVINDAPDEWCYMGDGSPICFIELTYPPKMMIIKPRHAVGDICYVPEKHKIDFVSDTHINVTYGNGDIVDFSLMQDCTWQEHQRILCSKSLGKWRSPRFMYKFMARYFVRITGVKCERLQDISITDIYAEGIKPSTITYAAPCLMPEGINTIEEFNIETDKTAFSELWNRSNKKYTWESNPWVVCYTYKMIKGE